MGCVLWSLTTRGRWDTAPRQKSKNLESFKGCHENTTQLHSFFFLLWWLLTYIKGGKKWAPKLCVLVLILIKTWIQITEELSQGIRSWVFFLVGVLCLFVFISGETLMGVGKKQTQERQISIWEDSWTLNVSELCFQSTNWYKVLSHWTISNLYIKN